MEAVNRVLEVGRMLRAMLTPEELSALDDMLSAGKRGQTTSLQRDQVIPMALDVPDSTVDYLNKPIQFREYHT
jgi:hypothetical protein